ncbi:two-component regulator propeller domain-containing protein [Shewanella amazonensis]|uniref:histidine kinase n=1 Tax=Shewanella amazonensis (strain ATCC BAA-1098 / SB2B) TaxID=326297 RepID=A1S6S1_SHEAM|nr:two-component regulator propeller domain-containing protein [Shewanella amazonensis]ABM00078.1 sensor histidine kinase [Shewanella amazonensis SB2B]
MSAVIRTIIYLMLLHFGNAWSAPEKIAQNVDFDSDNISAILIDKQGFMWLGTQDGLFFYDSYQLEKFRPDADTPGTIAALDIRNLYLSRDNSLWISTNSGGLSRFNPDTRTFTNYRHNSEDINSLSNDSVYDVADGPDGELWVATQIGLNRLNPATGQVRRYLKDDTNAASLPSNYVYTLFVDSSNRLWIGTIGGGLAYWAGETQGFISLELPNVITDVFSIVEQDGKYLWVGTRQGLLRITLDNLLVRRIQPDQGNEPELMIISLHLDANQLVLGTFGQGLKFYNTDTNQLSHASQDIPGAKDTITSMVKDSTGQLFYATWGRGAYKLDVTERNKSDDGTAKRTSLSLPNVAAMYAKSGSNKAWVGSFSDGLHWLDLDTQRLNRFTPSTSANNINGVLSIASFGADELLVGTSEGLWHLIGNGTVKAHFSHQPEETGSIGKGFVRVLQPDDSGDVWVGIGGDGLYKYHPDSGTFSSYTHDPSVPDSLSGNYITSLLIDGPYLWVGTRSNGLNLCQKDSMSCQRLQVHNSGLNHFYISDIAKDDLGNIWVGTDGGGLHKAEFHRTGVKTEVRITPEPGLAADSIKSILPGASGEVWFTTSDGLFSYHSNQKRFHKATDRVLNGLGGFSQRSRASTGEFNLLGTNNGVYLFSSISNVEPETQFPVRFTQIVSDSLANPILNTAIQDPFQMSVPWGGWLNVEFALLDFGSSAHSYQYRMSSESQWISLNNMHHLNFYKLDPGVHRLEVRGRGINQAWSQPATLHLTVIPPWWRNTTYIGLLLVCIALVAVSYHRFRMARWERYTRHLNALKEEKLAVIEKLRQNEQHLKSAFEGMRNLATRLQYAKEEERKSISRELHDQFGQSLTATQISLQLFRRQHPGDPKLIDTCITTIQAMIKQVRAISFDLRPSLLDDVGLVAGLHHQLNKMSSSLTHPIIFNADTDIPELSPELTITLFRVIQESVTNAIRHANATRIEVKLYPDGDKIKAEVSDNGVGFEPGGISAKVSKGGHLGLLGIEERVKSQNGNLNIKAIPHGGVSISVEFPYEK